MKTRARAVLIAVVLIGGCGVSLWQTLKEDYGVGVDSVSWLPAEARNITYAKIDFTARTAEFDIERKAFEKWCENRKMPLHELTDNGYHTVFRCLPILERKGLIAPIVEPNDVERAQHRGERTVKNFRQGDLFYEQRWSNGGGYSIGYDVKEKRGYYSHMHH